MNTNEKAAKLTFRRYHFIMIVIAYVIFFNVSIFSGEGPIRIRTGEAPRYVALTFDDGPHDYYTQELLGVLKEYDVRATFFVVGKQVAKYPAYLKDIHRAGHEICNHTYSHPNLSRLDNGALMNQLEWTRELVSKLTGQECKYFRPPGGRYNKQVIMETSRYGYKMILWSVFPQDHIEMKASEVSKRVLSGVYDGGVVLLHSGRKPTVEALPEIILKLRERGYEFVTISDLIKRDRNKPNLYSFYRSYPVEGEALTAEN